MKCLSRFLVAGFFCLGLPAHAGDLIIEVAGIRSDIGRVMLGVHVEMEGVEFPDRAGVMTSAWTTSRVGTWRLILQDLADGRYAVTVLHDENGNGDVDTNLLGIPEEGYGFSNDVMGFMGPPGFADASVIVGDEAGHALVTLRY